MKKFITLAMALVMVLSLVACGSSSKKVSKIVMGTSPDYPPYEFYSDSALTQFAGIDVEVAKFVAADMGADLQIEAMSFDYLVSSLGNGDFDMVLAAIEYTEERDLSCDFSDPYYTDLPPVVLVLESNASKYTSEADINNDATTVGAQKNTTKAMAAESKFENANLITEALVPTLINELKNGTIDCLVLDGNVGQTYADENSDIVILEGVVTWDEVEPYRILVQNGDPKGLLPGINAAIAKLVANDSAKIREFEDAVANLDTFIAE